MTLYTNKMGRTAGWQHFTHDADIGVRGCGATPAQAFEQAACALTAIVADLDRVRPQRQISIQCTAPDLEFLFTDWLNALVYEMATQRMLFSRFAVSIQDRQLTATAWGEPVDVARHHPVVEIKGATYTALSVSRDDTGLWCAQCIVDV
jgi:SHS2 domain-containing protein